MTTTTTTTTTTIIQKGARLRRTTDPELCIYFRHTHRLCSTSTRPEGTHSRAFQGGNHKHSHERTHTHTHIHVREARVASSARALGYNILLSAVLSAPSRKRENFTYPGRALSPFFPPGGVGGAHQLTNNPPKFRIPHTTERATRRD